jgi:hypothetical protein
MQQFGKEKVMHTAKRDFSSPERAMKRQLSNRQDMYTLTAAVHGIAYLTTI